MSSANRARQEIESGDRFAFGANWASFLAHLDETRIDDAVASLKTMLDRESLAGCRFLDIGSGSGLMSLAARRLGAHVVSFDYDPSSVACTEHVRRRWDVDDANWVVHHGSVLDRSFLVGLGSFDIVYAWGVLHHTGSLWVAAEHASERVGAGGRLFVAIYNDQGLPSRIWHRVKRRYNAAGPVGRRLLLLSTDMYFRARSAISRSPSSRARPRGMDRRHDLIDWVGGWPFEVATPDEVFEFFHQRGFVLEHLKTCGGSLGNNEYVFTRS